MCFIFQKRNRESEQLKSNLINWYETRNGLSYHICCLLIHICTITETHMNLSYGKKPTAFQTKWPTMPKYKLYLFFVRSLDLVAVEPNKKQHLRLFYSNFNGCDHRRKLTLHNGTGSFTLNAYINSLSRGDSIYLFCFFLWPIDSSLL